MVEVCEHDVLETACGNFTKFTTSVQLGTKMNRLDLEIKRSNKHFGRRFLIYLRNAWTYFNETYHRYSLPGSHDMMTFLKSGVQWSKSQVTFSESALCRCMHTDRRFAVEYRLVFLTYIRAAQATAR